MLHIVVRARELALRDVSPRNISLAMTMKNDGHSSMSIALQADLRPAKAPIKNDSSWIVQRRITK